MFKKSLVQNATDFVFHKNIIFVRKHVSNSKWLRIIFYNYFSPWYGIDQLAARKMMRVDQLDAGKNMSDVKRSF